MAMDDAFAALVQHAADTHSPGIRFSLLVSTKGESLTTEHAISLASGHPVTRAVDDALIPFGLELEVESAGEDEVRFRMVRMDGTP